MADDILKKASKKLGELVDENEKARKQPEQDRRDFISALAKEVVTTLSPLIAGLTMQSKKDREDLMRAIASIDVKVPPIASPQVKVPTINVPTPKVTVNPPQVKVPQINVPKTEINMPDIMDVRMTGVHNKAPMPVIMMDTKGKPMPFSMGAGGGGKADFIKIKDILTSTGASLINDAGQLRTDAGTPTISQDYGSGEIGSQTVRTVQATDAISSVNIVSGSASGTEYTDATNTELGDGGLIMARDSGGSIYGVRIGTGTSEVALRTVQASDASSSVNVIGGTLAAVTSVTNSVAANIVDSTGVAYSGSNPVPVTGTITGITNSTASALVDSTGVQYSGSNPVPVDLGSNNDVTATGSVANDSPDSGNPVKIGGKAYTTNPTAVATADRVDARFDVVGRQVVRPVQVRDLLQTAYVTEDEVEEVTLLAGASGVYHDLVYMVAANESDAAINLDIRQTTGGTVQMSLHVPAESTAGLSLGGATIPQDHADATWTVQNSATDNSNTNYSVTALFSKEV